MAATTEDMKQNIGKPTNIVVCFDCTGSMSACIADVRTKLRTLAKQMFEEIPGLRMGVIAHGDYCDGERCLQLLDLTDNIDAILDFLEHTPNTSGGDADECYEYALKMAGTMSWPEEGGSLLMIGDCAPHDVGYRLVNPLWEIAFDSKTLNICWKDELGSLLSRNVKVFPLQCMKNSYSVRENNFWESLASISQTPLLQLNDFGESTENLEAVAFASSGHENYTRYAERTKGRRSLLSTSYSTNMTALDSYVTTTDLAEDSIKDEASE